MNSEIVGAGMGAAAGVSVSGADAPWGSSTAGVCEAGAHVRHRQQASRSSLRPVATGPRVIAFSVATDPPEGPEDRLHQNHQIPPDRARTHIRHVLEYPVVERGVVAPADLPRTGDPGLDAEPQIPPAWAVAHLFHD